MTEIRFTNLKHFVLQLPTPVEPDFPKEFPDMSRVVRNSIVIKMIRREFDIRNFYYNGVFEISKWVEFEFTGMEIVFLSEDFEINSGFISVSFACL